MATDKRNGSAGSSKPPAPMNPASFQLQMRHNTEDINEYLSDLGQWEEEIKKKESFLLKQKPILKQSAPPIRGDKRNENTKTAPKGTAAKKDVSPAQRIKSFDYNSWEKFDVDKACADVQQDEEEEEDSFEENEEEITNEQIEEVKGFKRKQKAILEKEKGNDLFKEGKYEAAIEHYTSGVQQDPSNAILVANRAMALLKMGRFAAAESDCSAAIQLDPLYAKAYFRRGTARRSLKNHSGAVEDFRKVLELDKKNPQASQEIEQLQKLLKSEQGKSKQEQSGPFVRPVKRPEHLRSKKPLRRILVEEVGNGSEPTSSGEQGVVKEKEVVTNTEAKDDSPCGESVDSVEGSCENHQGNERNGKQGIMETLSVERLSSPGNERTSVSTNIESGSPSQSLSGGVNNRFENAAANHNSPPLSSCKPQQQQNQRQEQSLEKPSSQNSPPLSTGGNARDPGTQPGTFPRGGVGGGGVDHSPSAGGISRGSSDEEEEEGLSTAGKHLRITAEHSETTVTDRTGRSDSNLVQQDADSSSKGGEESKQTVPPRSPTVAARRNLSASLPPVPTSAYQFSSSWKSFGGCRDMQAKYFKQIPSSEYVTVFNQLLETSVFSEVLEILRDHYVSLGRSCLVELQQLSRVSRFTVAVMFLSKREKQVLTEIFLRLEEIHRESRKDVSDLKRTYSLS